MRPFKIELGADEIQSLDVVHQYAKQAFEKLGFM